MRVDGLSQVAKWNTEWEVEVKSTEARIKELDTTITGLFDKLKGLIFPSADLGTGDGGVRFYIYDTKTGATLSVEAPKDFIEKLRPIVEQAKKDAIATIPKKIEEAERKARELGKTFTEKDANKVAEDTVKKAVEALPVSISDDNKKIIISRNPENAEFLPANLQKYMSEGSLATSSWARTAVKAVEVAKSTGVGIEKAMSSADYRTIQALEKLALENPNIKFKVFTQFEESEASAFSLAELLLWLNPNNPQLANVKPHNTAQFEAGKGSTQSFKFLQTQTVEMAGAWVDSQKGRNAEEVKNELKAKFAADLAPVEEAEGIENIMMQGLLAVCLSNDKIIKALGIKDKEDWIRAQMPVDLDAIIPALQANLEGAPAIVTLALLEAVKEKYGKNFKILNMKEDMPLYNAEGTIIGHAKITGSHGVASKHFAGIKKQLDDAEKERAQLQENLTYVQGLVEMTGTLLT